MIKNNVLVINVKQLKEQYDTNPNICLIDVREQHEWDEIRIPGAKHIPKDQITESIEAVMPNLNQPIYLHCRSGMRSLYAAQQLKEMGYEQVYNVDGGILHWEECGYPVIKE